METLQIKTSSRIEMLNITSQIQSVVSKSGIKEGLCILFVPHTTCGITINENADPDVKKDIIYGTNKVIPPSREFRHIEGNSDAHIKTTLFGLSEHIIINQGKLLLGTWQGIYFCEFDGPRIRKLHIKIIEG